ncbi:MAG: AraC family transcriptional regulator [Clostridiaceae bacterium]
MSTKIEDKDRVFGFLKKYITFSMVMILLVISIVFFLVYYNMEVERIIGNSTNSLLQMTGSCDALFEPMRKIAYQIHNDTEITSMVNDINKDATFLNKTYGRLKSYTIMASNIVSIYVYNKQTDCFYTTLHNDPKRKRIEFWDKDAVNLIDNFDNVKILHPIARKIKMEGAPDVPNNTINIYSIFYNLPIASADYIGTVVIINISESWVKNSIESFNNNIKGELCIMNEEGVLVSSLYKDDILNNISHEDFASGILNSKNDTGSFICDVQNTKSFITYVKSSRFGWYFIRIIPYISIYDNLKKIGIITILMFAVYIFIGYIVSYMITGRAKRSIDDIIIDLQNQIKDNRSELEKRKEEYLYISMLNELPLSCEKVKEDFKRLNILLPVEDELVLVLFRIDHYNELCSRFKTHEITLLKQAIIKEAGHKLHEKCIIEMVDMKDDLITLIISDNSLPEELIRLDEIIRLIQDSVEKNIKLSLSAVISPSGYTFSDIGLLYTEVKQASNCRLFYGHKCIIHTEDLKMLYNKEYVHPYAKEKLLLDALMLGKIEQAEKLLEEILYSVNGYTYKAINSLLLRLTFSIINTFESVENISKYSIDYDFNTFTSNLNKCETMEEIKNNFTTMFNHVFMQLEKQKNSKYGVLVNDAIDIINQHYADESLCQNTIADKLGISPNYLGRLFKTYTNKSIGDYLNKLRVGKTLELLEESSMPVSDVAAKAGFYSKSYFYTIFKKITGITPSEYRQNSKKEEPSARV